MSDIDFHARTLGRQSEPSRRMALATLSAPVAARSGAEHSPTLIALRSNSTPLYRSRKTTNPHTNQSV